MDTHATQPRPAVPHDPAGADGTRSALGELRGASPAMNALYQQIERVAATDAPVLITGEGGTGKELVARTLHALSARRGRPFVPVNCGAIVPELVEAELFGHEKGSFTGAAERRAGYFEHASGGTLFLDEIGEMSPPMQVKLLHVLQTGHLLRVGGTERVAVDARIIAATHRDLDAAQRSGAFRHDLLYRLAVFPLHVPPLREREGDVELLARHFVDELNVREEAHKTLSRRSLDALRGNPWPGNVRELRNAVRRAYIMADRQVELGSATSMPRRRVQRDAEGALRFGVGTSLADAQREILLATLEYFGGDKRRTARVLGISLKTLYNRLGVYGDTHHVRRRAPMTSTAGHH
jgi:DNA-binding NtrC family response regulator